MSSTRGPIVILIMGIGGMIFFGVLANWLVGKNPVIAKHASYREEVLEQFPVMKVGLSRQRKDYTLRLWVDPEEWTGVAYSKDQLPAVFGPMRDHFERSLETRRAPDKLDVIVLSVPGFGCSSEQELCRQSFDLRQARLVFRKELADLLEATVVSLGPAEEGTLRLVLAGKPRQEALPRAAQRLASYLGGRWSRVEIKIGRGLWEYDGQGRPLDGDAGTKPGSGGAKPSGPAATPKEEPPDPAGNAPKRR